MKFKYAFSWLLLLTACASGPLRPPYPAYISVDELPDAFVAGLPGVRAKQMSVDPRTQRGSYRITVPADWSFRFASKSVAGTKRGNLRDGR